LSETGPSDARLFARQQVRTRRFTLGTARTFSISPDGQRVVFLRSASGSNPANSLWAYDIATAREREVADPSALSAGEEEPGQEERARRERSRELSAGIVAYACDDAVAHAAFSLNGRLWWCDLVAGAPATELPNPGSVVDPRPDPTGCKVAFLSGPRLCTVPTSGEQGCAVLAEEGGVTWGAAEFIAAEEMDRSRGYWWAPDGKSLLVTRVDSRAVEVLWTAEGADPSVTPQQHRFPRAGTANALVTLWHVPLASSAGERVEIRWDQARFAYLVAVHWSRHGPPLLLVEQRDHKSCAVLAVDLESSTTSLVAEADDPAWVAWPLGVPAWLEGGALLWCEASDGTNRLKVGPELITPPGLQVRAVLSTSGKVVFSASTEPEAIEAWRWSAADGLHPLTEAGGIAHAVGEGDVRVVVSQSMAWDGSRCEVRAPGAPPRLLESHAEEPVVRPRVRFLRAGPRGLSVGVVLPEGHEGGKLPVLMAPYGGPGAQRVLACRSAWLEHQWFANQGFAVVVADGRGTPGRGPAFEREIYLDFAGPVLEDQVEALMAAAAEVPELDVCRVGIRGWSFGGYLAALAVLARPDVFHAAVAGAPVTDWHLYDTYYTERFLGHPDEQPGAYERSSLLRLAPALSRPLLLVHGLADDNVYLAHTLALSNALLVAGRQHSFLPLPGITHVTARADVSESLLLYQVEFLRRALAPAG